MTLTIEQIYDRYAEPEFARTISIKRRNVDGSYEASYSDIKDLTKYPVVTKDAVDQINISLPNNEYSSGTITSDNVTLKLKNERGQVSNEGTETSMFAGFIRHKSLVKIESGYVDKYTDPLNPVEVTEVVFEGFIDDSLSDSNFNNIETIVVTDLMTTLLKEITVSDVGAVGIDTLETVMLELMDRPPFTDFFTVGAGNINAGFDFTLVDISQYDDGETLLDVIQDLSVDHSVAHIVDGDFIYEPFDPSASLIYNFGTSPERKGNRFSNYKSGAVSVKDKLYWEGTALSELAANRVYNRPFTYDIKGITDATNRGNFLAYIIDEVSPRKRVFDMPVKFLPTLKLLDKIAVVREGFLPADAWIIGNIVLGTSKFKRAIGSIQIAGSDRWIIRAIRHDNELITWLTLQEIL
ncbi:MAG: hypothetical protein ACTSW1_08285 [Candidatus Hodarchaeales archaeon]